MDAIVAASAPLKIAFVLNYWSSRGGTERYAHNLARWLVGRGHIVHVFCRDAAIQRDNAPKGNLVFRPWSGAGRGFLGIARGYLSSRSIAGSSFDIVQGFGRSASHDVFRAGGGVHQAWLDIRNSTGPGRLRSCFSAQDRLERWIDRRAFVRARVVVCNSQLVAEQVVRIHGLKRQQIRVVRNGVDLERFRPRPAARESARRFWSVPPQGRVAVFVGSGFKRKGLETAAMAFEHLAVPGDRLVVIGRDSQAASFLRPLRRRLGDRLVVMGHVSQVEKWIVGADALLLPTRYDPAANATLEAMACAIPPVTTLFDGNNELVPDEHLIVNEPGNVKQCAAALAYGWANKDRLGAECRKVAAQWPVSRNGEAMESIYLQLVDGPSVNEELMNG